MSCPHPNKKASRDGWECERCGLSWSLCRKEIIEARKKAKRLVAELNKRAKRKGPRHLHIIRKYLFGAKPYSIEELENTPWSGLHG